jgi:hypothetical protein
MERRLHKSKPAAHGWQGFSESRFSTGEYRYFCPLFFFLSLTILRTTRGSPAFKKAKGRQTENLREPVWGGIHMALLAFYGGLLIGVVAGMVAMGLVSMIRFGKEVNELEPTLHQEN